jgi:hypothetical protein
MFEDEDEGRERETIIFRPAHALHPASQRDYCDRCFDEVFLDRRRFEAQVELAKTVEARDGTFVQSAGERRIVEWLAAQGIVYRYDVKFRIVGEFQIRPDFYLPAP